MSVRNFLDGSEHRQPARHKRLDFVICALRNLRGGSVLTVVNEPGEEAIDPARVAALDLTPMFRVALGAARQLAPLKA